MGATDGISRGGRLPPGSPERGTHSAPIQGSILLTLMYRVQLDKITHEQSKFRNAVYWYKWDIPLNYWVNGDVKDMKWLHEGSQTVNPIKVFLQLLVCL